MKTYIKWMEEPFILAFLDVLVVNAGFLFAFLLRFGVELQSSGSFHAYLTLAPVLSLASVALLFMCDLYKNWLQRSLTELIYALMLVSVCLAIVTMAASFWSRQPEFSRAVLAIAVVLHLTLLTASRYAILKLLRAHFGGRSVMIVADTLDEATSLAPKISGFANGWYVIKHWLLASEMDAFDSAVAKIDVVVIASDVLNRAEVARRAARHGKLVLIAPRPYELTLFGAQPHYLDDCMMLSIEQHRLENGDLLVKRLMDVVISLIAIAVASPLLLVLRILIPLESKGPALFKQERVGKDGKLYQVWKLRTMVANAEVLTGPILATHNDPRITRLGTFLRSTRIDELPQFFNVLMGDMSVVGPRPERLHFVKQFEENTPGYSARFVVKPGITGLAQVMGRYSTSAERKLRFDLIYVFKYSPLLDIKILFQTVRVVFQREQAEGMNHEGDAAKIPLQAFHNFAPQDASTSSI
jgi:exopolysaccharide biosynthesis polyprenyl glycosylphosphotransferase